MIFSPIYFPVKNNAYSIYSYIGDKKQNTRLINRYIKKGILSQKIIIINPPKDSMTLENSLQSHSLEEILAFISSKTRIRKETLIIINETDLIDSNGFYCNMQKSLGSLNNLACNGAQIIFFGKNSMNKGLPILSALALAISDEVHKTQFIKKNKGFLKVICGPMFADKSTILIHDYQDISNYCIEKFGNTNKICLAKAKKANRETDIVDRHGNRISPNIRPDTLSELVSYIKENPHLEYILIDEAQFISYHENLTINDQMELMLAALEILKLTDSGINFLIYGLDQYYAKEPFLTISFLLYIADQIIKLVAVCNGCGGPANHSLRIENNLKGTLDPNATYVAVCKRCDQLKSLLSRIKIFDDPLVDIKK